MTIIVMTIIRSAEDTMEPPKPLLDSRNFSKSTTTGLPVLGLEGDPSFEHPPDPAAFIHGPADVAGNRHAVLPQSLFNSALG